MGLPRELIDEIMRHNDLQTLKECSLTSRTFYSAARPKIHARMRLGVGSAMRGCKLSPGTQFNLKTYDEQADVFHARYLSAAEERGLLRYGYIREVSLNFLRLVHPEKVLQLQQLRALETVHTLTINSLALPRILPIFDSCFSRFVPTLRSLSLRNTSREDINQLAEFTYQFPHLDDLDLTLHSRMDGHHAPPRSVWPRPRQPLPLRGHLHLDGPPCVVQWLVDLPGGIRFRSINVDRFLNDLEKLLAACSSTLEVFTIRYIDPCESVT